MRHRNGTALWVGSALIWLVASSSPAFAQAVDRAGKGDDPDPSSASPAPSSKRGVVRMSRAVVCRTIDGYEDFEPLPDAAQTSEEKLLIYYRVVRCKIESVDDVYVAHITQDNEIRKRGEKKILRQKRKVVDYEAKSPNPPRQIYIKNQISLKGLAPGDYELTIILHDELDKGSPPTTQLVRFKVIPPHDGGRDTGKADGPPRPRAKPPAAKAQEAPAG